MKEERKTKTKLIEELVQLRKRVARLEKERTGLKVQKGLARKDDPSVRPFYENLALGYQSLDDKGFISDVNQTWLDMLGYSREEVIGRWFGDFIAPGYRSQFEENFPLFKAAGAIKDIEFEMVRKDGTRLFVAYDGRIQCDGQRNFKQTHCLMKDITKRKRLEETILQSETRFKALVEFSSDHIFLLDPNGTYLVSNNRVDQFRLESGESLVGQNLRDAYPPEIAEFYQRQLEQVLKTGQVVDFEHPMPEADGQHYHLDTLYPIHHDGKVWAVGGICRDITERKRAEKELQENQERLELAISGSDGGIWDLELDPNTPNVLPDTIYLSPRLKKLIGYEEHEFPNSIEAWKSRIVPEDLVLVNKFAQNHFEGRTNFHEAEYRIYHKDGSIRWLYTHGKILRNEQGKPIRWTGIDWDITEQKRMEEALQESEKRYRTVVQDQTEIICRFDPDGRYVFVNDVYCRFFGKSKDELVGHKWFPDAYPKDLEMIQEKLKTMSPDNPVILIENRVYSGGNDLHWMQFINRGFYDQQGTLLEIQSVGRDITERKRAEEEIGRSREQLRTLSSHLQSLREEERALIAREIHDELGQALTILKMDSFWLAKRFPENQKDLIEKTQSMSKLIDSTIQTVRRISTELRPGILDDLGLIAAIEWQTQDFQDRTGIKCVFDSPLEEVELDRNRSTAVFRIFQETLTNVVRHANATIVNINVREEEKNLLVEIEDNGKGITDEEVSDPKSLGLLGMRERAHIFGGKVMVKGEPGKGTTVTVRIPLFNEEYRMKDDRRKTREEE